MKPSEADKIIAEFMGTIEVIDVKCLACGGNRPVHLEYSKSLDALVPVWEELGSLPRFYYKNGDGSLNVCEINVIEKGFLVTKFTAVSKTIQQAAAIATAKAIKEIERDE